MRRVKWTSLSPELRERLTNTIEIEEFLKDFDEDSLYLEFDEEALKEMAEKYE